MKQRTLGRREAGKNLTVAVALFFSLFGAIALAVETVAPTPLRVQEVARTLPKAPKGHVESCNDRGTWGNDDLKRRLAPSLREAERLLKRDFPTWDDDAYLEFSRTGERVNGERMTRDRQNWLLPLALAECSQYEGRFLAKIEEVLFALLSQPTWMLPAHDIALESFSGGRHTVDLNSAEIADSVGQVVFMLGHKLNPELTRRIRLVLEERVFGNVRNSIRDGKRNTWLSADNNWNPVCWKGVMSAALAVLADRQDRATFVVAAEKSAKKYIAGFPDDGYAIEGLSYWNYGFGRFSELREILWRATSGEVDLFKDPKVREIAMFGPRFEMFPGNLAAFGDSVIGGKVDSETLMYINSALNLSLMTYQGASASQRLISLFPRSAPDEGNQGQKKVSSIGKRSYFDKVGVLVSRPGAGSVSRLAITIKAGGNGSHSHNDIGSYSIGVGSDQPVGDPGGLRYYSKWSFDSRRYNSKVLNSYGHPVPVVAGHLQLEASKVTPKVLEIHFADALDEIVIDLASAYAVPGLTGLKRTMRYDRSGAGSVEIADQFEFTSPNIFEVALTSVGKWKLITANVLEFTSGKEVLKATIEAPGAFDLVTEKIKENGAEFERIGIRLRELHQSGTVKVTYVPLH